MKDCFVISPIGDEGSVTRQKADKVLRYVIKPPLEEMGFNPERADGIDKPGLITSQIIRRIIDDEVVVADLSDKNPNVFYELAIRHALKKPVIHIMSKGEYLPFDVANSRTIFYDIGDLDSVESAKQSIKSQLQQVLKNPEDVETPFSISVELKDLRSSGDPERNVLAEILEEMGKLRSDISRTLDPRYSIKREELMQIFNRLDLIVGVIDSNNAYERGVYNRRDNAIGMEVEFSKSLDPASQPTFFLGLVYSEYGRDSYVSLMAEECYALAKKKNYHQLEMALSSLHKANDIFIHSWDISRRYVGDLMDSRERMNEVLHRFTESLKRSSRL